MKQITSSKRVLIAVAFSAAMGCQASHEASHPTSKVSTASQASPAAPAAPAPTPTAVSEKQAREALRQVGADPAADAIWIEGINNRALSDTDRHDLIEDLNETGFASPANPTATDLPKIRARLKLIDRLAPSAMDEVNAAAFKEARKDLVQMEKQAAAGESR